jgi:hypothetical protein
VTITYEHRELLEAAIPRGVEIRPDFWNKLEAAIDAYCALDEHRAKRPPVAARRFWKGIHDDARALVDKLSNLKRTASVNEFLIALRRLSEHADVAIKAHGTIASGFRGRSNVHREHLYSAVLDLWEYDLGQRVRVSTTGNARTGPLIRFFRACVLPALDPNQINADESHKLPKPETIASIVRRRKERQRRGALKRRK